MQRELSTKSKHPLIASLSSSIIGFLGPLFGMVFLWLVAPSSSRINTESWALTAAVAAFVIWGVGGFIIEYIAAKTVKVELSRDGRLKMRGRTPWNFMLMIPTSRLRHVTVEQKQWQVKRGVADMYIYSLANTRASVVIKSAPKSDIDNFVHEIERTKQEGYGENAL